MQDTLPPAFTEKELKFTFGLQIICCSPFSQNRPTARLPRSVQTLVHLSLEALKCGCCALALQDWWELSRSRVQKLRFLQVVEDDKATLYYNVDNSMTPHGEPPQSAEFPLVRPSRSITPISNTRNHVRIWLRAFNISLMPPASPCLCPPSPSWSQSLI